MWQLYLLGAVVVSALFQALRSVTTNPLGVDDDDLKEIGKSWLVCTTLFYTWAWCAIKTVMEAL